MKTAINRVISRLSVRRVREGVYRAKCPLHNGRSDTSLSITDTDDRFLIHCHAGCDYRSILAALNLSSAADLFNNAKDSSDRRIQGLARAGLSKWCNHRLIQSFSSLRGVEDEIGAISEELSQYVMDQASRDPQTEDKLWSQLKRAYEKRTELEREIDILNGNNEGAKLDIWRSAS
jgi:hypothetical protein